MNKETKGYAFAWYQDWLTTVRYRCGLCRAEIGQPCRNVFSGEVKSDTHTCRELEKK